VKLRRIADRASAYYWMRSSS